MRPFWLLIMLLITGCSGTMNGVGEDMQRAGANLSDRYGPQSAPPPPPLSATVRPDERHPDYTPDDRLPYGRDPYPLYDDRR